MSAIENVAIPLELAGHPEPFDAAHGALEKVGLGRRVSHYPDQLSGGEQQRVAVARAFVADPKLLLADEPTGNLDGETGEMVFNLMFEMQAAYGTTLCLITHDLSLAARCERTIHLADGRVTRDQITAVSPQ
jgi:putative ABC transport system ATP-binding protein